MDDNKDIAFDDVKAVFDKNVTAGDYDAQLDDYMANEVVPYWVSVSPEDDGDYKRSVQVTKKARRGKGKVGAKIGYANLIEYGSEDTPEFAPRQLTVTHFNGDDVTAVGE